MRISSLSDPSAGIHTAGETLVDSSAQRIAGVAATRSDEPTMNAVTNASRKPLAPVALRTRSTIAGMVKSANARTNSVTNDSDIRPASSPGTVVFSLNVVSAVATRARIPSAATIVSHSGVRTTATIEFLI